MVPVTCEVTEFFNKSIVGKGMPEMSKSGKTRRAA